MLSLVNSSLSLADSTGRSRWGILLFIVVLAIVNYIVKRKFRLNPWLMVIADIILAMVFFLM